MYKDKKEGQYLAASESLTLDLVLAHPQQHVAVLKVTGEAGF